MTTNTRSVLPAALGFAFVAVAFAQTFWIAVLCLVGAAAFQLAHGLYRGDLSLAELRERAEAARTGFAHPDRAGDRPAADGGGGATGAPQTLPPLPTAPRVR